MVAPQSDTRQGLDMAGATADPVLERFRAGLCGIHGPRLARAVLFGSRARGDNAPDSDYDVAVFLHDYTSRWDELWKLGGLTTEILMDTGAVVSPKPFPAAAYDDDRPLMQAIRREGLEL